MPARFDDDLRLNIYGSSQGTLCRKDTGILGRRYLIRERGLDEWTMAKFRLGFVPFYMDNFPGHVVMPIFDVYGSLIALSFRPIFQYIHAGNRRVVAINPQNDGDCYSYVNERAMHARISAAEVTGISSHEPKYWNESFPKGEHLFGLNLAKYDIVKSGYAILVEGQFDVMMMHSMGFRNAVGLCGTAFTPLHAMLLRRWTRQVLVMFDGDRAGRASALKVKDILDVYGFHAHAGTSRGPVLCPMKCGMASMPEGYDPDKFLRTNGSYLMWRIIADSMAQSSMTIRSHNVAA